ncbi:DUF134 domain-containing protein [Candidatus Peregrinibacteria bacterium]|nr:DUF134 domain-containing protein [Candidatus Peregrinibacteria bacterium]
MGGCTKSNYFKPKGIPISILEKITIEKDEIEAIRLRNLEDFDQNAAAERMGISQSTFQRILKKANFKIADAIINGKAIQL